MLKEFKEFIMRGNVVDMAVGIIIGAAFGAIVTSLVNDVIMPPIGMLLGNVDFASLAIVLKEATAEEPAVTINYGAFINTVISFLIIAFVIFLLIRNINRLRKEAEEEPAAEPTTQECPFCRSTIPLGAVRCAYCTSQLPLG
jgi:large conductance mechanosensitive channel